MGGHVSSYKMPLRNVSCSGCLYEYHMRKPLFLHTEIWHGIKVHMSGAAYLNFPPQTAAEYQSESGQPLGKACVIIIEEIWPRIHF